MAVRTPAQGVRGPGPRQGRVSTSGGSLLALGTCHAVGARRKQRDIHDVARLRRGLDVHPLQPWRAADHLAVMLAPAFDQHLRFGAYLRSIERKPMRVDPL